MATLVRLAGGENYDLFKTPSGMRLGTPSFSDADIGRRVNLVLDPAADEGAVRHGAVDVLVLGLHLTGVNGTSFTVSDRPPKNETLALAPPYVSQPVTICYKHVRAYQVMGTP